MCVSVWCGRGSLGVQQRAAEGGDKRTWGCSSKQREAVVNNKQVGSVVRRLSWLSGWETGYVP